MQRSIGKENKCCIIFNGIDVLEKFALFTMIFESELTIFSLSTWGLTWDLQVSKGLCIQYIEFDMLTKGATPLITTELFSIAPWNTRMSCRPESSIIYVGNNWSRDRSCCSARLRARLSTKLFGST